MSIERFFHNILHPFVALFDKVFGQDARQKFADAAHALLNSELGKIAWAAVNEVEKLAVAGTEKRAEAFANIVAAAKAAGLDFKSSFINLLIEVAVAKLKGNG